MTKIYKKYQEIEREIEILTCKKLKLESSVKIPLTIWYSFHSKLLDNINIIRNSELDYNIKTSQLITDLRNLCNTYEKLLIENIKD